MGSQVEMDRGKGLDGTWWGGNHVRLRVGDTILDSPKGHILARQLEEVGRVFRPTSLDEIKAEEICFSRRGVNAVLKQLESAVG